MPLKRTLSFPTLVLYGLGTTIGAGVYALLGEVAGIAGMRAPLGFLAAAVLAGVSALSFCELAARLPHAGGEAVYVGAAFGSRALSRGVGLAIAVAACLSVATVSRGFVGYAGTLLPMPDLLAVALLLVALGAVAGWGIEASARLAALLTLVEAGGLLLLVGACHRAFASLPERWPEILPAGGADAWTGVGAATLLCFYAFLGFEDMVNVAEEVRDVRRVMPLAIVTTLAVTLLLYLLVATAAVLSLPPAELAASEAPLATLFTRATGLPPTAILAIGVIAMLNGALIQLIKSSRILYGLARRGDLPDWLARVHPVRQTPLLATGVSVAAALVLAIALPIDSLARLTSGVTLAVFALVNLALLRIRRRDPRPPGVPAMPGWVPAAGAVVSTGFLIFEVARQLRA